MSAFENHRIIVIDDCPSIHQDFKKILAHEPAAAKALSHHLFADEAASPATGSESSATFSAQARFHLHHAHHGEEGFEMIRRAAEADEHYALAFVDMRMNPGWDGLATIRAIREVDSQIAIVICTAHVDYALDQIAHQSGSPDKLLILKKPFDPMEVAQLAGSLCHRWTLDRTTLRQRQELEETIRQRNVDLAGARDHARLRMDKLETIVEQRTTELRRAALQDALTGLPNRAFFFDRLARAVTLRQRNPQSRFAVLFIDFDRFKVINDSLGHDVGDQLLVAISRRLTAVLRGCDSFMPVTPATEGGATSARLGGDEFCVLLENLQRDEDAAHVAQRLLTELSQPYTLQGRKVVSTPSIGITLSSLGYSSAEEMLRDADTAMYRAKSLGRARLVVFDHAMHERAMRRLVLENDIRLAIERHELHLQYQPIVSLDSGMPAGAECLLRWHHSERGPIPPVEFIPLAEETGAIKAIGEWVFRSAAEQLARWHGSVPQWDRAYLSINVSRRQLDDDNLELAVRDVLRNTRVPPRNIVLEITETTLMEDPELARDFIAAMRGLGLRVYLDDFGAGFSSMGFLHDFEFDGLKLDRGFLCRPQDSRRSAACIHSMITLARDLQMEVIAEGVESLEQAVLLQALQCARAQGYLFAGPCNADELIEFFTRNPQAMLATA